MSELKRYNDIDDYSNTGNMVLKKKHSNTPTFYRVNNIYPKLILEVLDINYETFLKNEGGVEEKAYSLEPTTTQKRRKRNNYHNQKAVYKKILEDDNYQPPHITKAMGMKIQQARSTKLMSQETLAKKLSIPVYIIRLYEKGRGLYDRYYLDPICDELGITINKH
jgi:DNA-binding transcriptional regulator YiaG